MKQSLLVAGAVLSIATVSQAAEITFTGGDTSNPTNLSSAANWGGTLPGANDVGVIDSDKAPRYVVNSDLAFGGLKITGTATANIAGAATLTLGASGLVRTGKGNLFIRCPMATSAAQTWDLGQVSEFNTYSTITGTADLCITNFSQYVQHLATVGYDGKISYYRASTSQENTWIKYQGSGKWASTVRFMTALPIFVVPPSNGATVNWSDVFPVNQPYVGNWSAKFGLAGYGGASAKVLFKAGDSLTFPSGSTPYHMTVCGTFEQTGGTITKQDNYYLTLGHPSSNPSWTYDLPCIYRMSGGDINVATVLIGYTSANASGDNVYFQQTGGKVKVPYSSAVGGGIALGGGTSRHYTVAEYKMEGGTLDTTSAYGGSAALGLARPLQNNTTLPATGFIMTGGTVYAQWLNFGSDSAFWDAALTKISNGYGLLDISGGSFNISRYTDASVPDSWAKFSNSWNSDPTASNCAYSVRLHGGKVTRSNDSQYAWPLLTCLPKSAIGTSLGSDNKDYVFNAPLYGTGVLKKDGTGTLLVKDAARFTGKVEVNGGTLELEAGSGEDIDPDKCFRWLASSLTGLEDGKIVAEWADVNYGLVAATNENPKYNSYTWRQAGPVFKKTGVNGLPSVQYSGGQSITVPYATNPLWARTNCTIVAVVKPTGTTSFLYGRYNAPIVSMMPGSDLAYLTVGGYGNNNGAQSWRPGVARRWQGDSYKGSDAEKGFYGRNGVSFNDGDIHAFAITLNGNRMTITGDGDVTNAVWTTSSVVSPFGYHNNSYHRDESYRGRLFIGGHVVDNCDGAFYKGHILELRIYTNRLFTASEQLKVTRHLLAQYGGDKRLMACAKTTRNTGAPGAFSRSYTAPTPVETAASWDADDIAAEDGAQVTSWASADGTKNATTAISGGAAPTLVRNAINGHAALHFDRAGKTALGIASADSPVTGSKSLTAAVVWRTETAGTTWSSGTYGNFGSFTGLLSTLGSSTDGCFSLYYFNRSAVSAAYGCSAGDTSILTRKPYRLNDGEVHISILACDGENKKYRLMTDGCFTTGSLAQNGTARGAFDVMIGAMVKGSTTATAYFDGDIAAVKLYGTALTKEQMIDLGEHWAKKYATQLLVGYKFKETHLRESGLGATNITVAAGARLSMPLTDESPYTLGAGTTLSGAGEFLGTNRFAEGATLDLATATPAQFDELNLAGGATVKVSKDAFGQFKVRRLVASGANTIDISAGTAEPGRRETVIAYDEADIDDAATWTVSGDHPGFASIVNDTKNRRLILRLKYGTLLIVR